MGTGLMIWLSILGMINVAMYYSWLKLKDTNNDGRFGEAMLFFVFAIIVFIVDISTIASLIF